MRHRTQHQPQEHSYYNFCISIRLAAAEDLSRKFTAVISGKSNFNNSLKQS
jgi:hypothetical protein